MPKKFAHAEDSDHLLAIGAVAAIPLVAGCLLPIGSIEGGNSICIFREVTGLPCPLCGATRAFIAFGHGDSGWLNYNGYWVLVSVLTLLAVAALGAARFLSGRPLKLPRPRRAPLLRSTWATTALLALFVAPGWIWALVNRNHIL